MLTRIVGLILIGIAVAGCPFDKDKDGRVIISDACETVYRLLYREDGRFILTEAEYDALRPINQVKITNVKRWFKSECPVQYALTAGGKKK